MASGLLEALKGRLDIVDVISDYVQLKKAGVNYKGLCPFHTEKTPSFTVNPDKEMFYCFGCGAGGDMVSFVMKQESMSFPEALHFLARKAGLRPEDYETGDYRKHSDEKSSVRAVLKAAGEFYKSQLEANPRAGEYLAKRGLDAQTVTKFALGYAPDDWGALCNYLKTKNFSGQAMISAGVAQSGKKGPYDFLRGRVVFPIFDAQGEPIAFGGRVMDNSLPKYLNSPDTMLFKKGETLYGLNLAKDAIKRKGYAVFTEGYLDVIMCHKEGFSHAVAPLGTALTPGHLKKIGRLTNKTVLLFDGDQAGMSAAKRGAALALENDFRVKVALLPAGEDPDSLLRAKGAAALKRHLAQAYSPLEFIIKTSKGPKVDAVREAAGVIASVKEPIMQEELIRELSELARVREEAVRQQVLRKSGRAEGGPNGKGASAGRPGAFRHDEESLLLSVFVNMPGMRAGISAELELDDLTNEAAKNLFMKLKDSDILTEEEKSLLAKVAIEPGFMPGEAENTIKDCLNKLKLRKLEKNIGAAAQSGDARLLKELYREKQELKGGP